MGKTVTMHTFCKFCKGSQTIKVKSKDFEKYETGKYFVQEAFPYLKPEERELLISGMCGSCWDNLFDIDEDEAL